MPRDHTTSTLVVTHLDLAHPTLERVPVTREGWSFELKRDGFRALVMKGDDQVRILSRSGRSLLDAFPEVALALSRRRACSMRSCSTASRRAG
ncbi:MAG: hypothetical protein M3Z31_02320 [Pseudomonadota bacterium]|nr:hypothetical protein [Pseudomonadota bacterium]